MPSLWANNSPSSWDTSSWDGGNSYLREIEERKRSGIEERAKGLYLKEGDQFVIQDLLFTHHRDYLVDRKGCVVSSDQLHRKSLFIYCVPLTPNAREEFIDHTRTLIDMYDYLLVLGFQVVLVARDESDGDIDSISGDHRFEQLFGDMPWLAIPYLDSQSREDCYAKLGYSWNTPNLIVFDENGKITMAAALTNIEMYGIESFPFDSARATQLDKEKRQALAGKLSWKVLLSCDLDQDLDYSRWINHISFTRRAYPYGRDSLGHMYNKKTIGLLFYDRMTRNHQVFIEKLRDAYIKYRDEFEVVTVPLCWSDKMTWMQADERCYLFDCERMPWVNLQFTDPVCRKLWTFFRYERKNPETPVLVIYGSSGRIVERHGAEVLDKYGVDAYPFTKEKAVEIETQNIKQCRLFSLLQEDLFSGMDGIMVPCRQLVGKRVLFLFESSLSFNRHILMWSLRHQYLKMKGTNEEFEVVYISLLSNEHYYWKYVHAMPWIVHPYSDGFGRQFLLRFFKNVDYYGSGWVGLVAFDESGCIKAKKQLCGGNDADCDMRGKSFPFIDEDLEVEIRDDVFIAYDWGQL